MKELLRTDSCGDLEMVTLSYLWGTVLGSCAWHSSFEEPVRQRCGVRCDWTTLPCSKGRGMTSVVLEFGEAKSSAEATDRGEGRIDVLWRLSSQDAFDCSDALKVLAAAGHAAHQYLEKLETSRSLCLSTSTIPRSSITRRYRRFVVDARPG